MSLIVLFAGGASSTTLVMDAGVQSDEAFGADGEVNFRLIAGAGIASAEAFGADGKLGFRIIAGAGIATGEAFGEDGELNLQLVDVAGIESGEAFGALGQASFCLPGESGIASAEAFGEDGAVEGGDPVLPPQPAYFGIVRRSRRTRRVLLPADTVLRAPRGIPSPEAFGLRGEIRLELRLGMLAGIAPAAAVARDARARHELRLRGSSGVPAPAAFGLGGAVGHRPPPWMFDA